MQNKSRSGRQANPKAGGKRRISGEKSPVPLKVGLTGNIGSGKSTAASLFSELGVPTFDTDSIGHELLESDPRIRSEVVKAFGKRIITGGLIDRHSLGEIVFGDPRKKEKLESILHPAIMSSVDERLRQYSGRSYAIVEVPLLYEAELSGEFDYVILVKAEERNAVERAASKLGISKDAVVKRLTTQIAQSEKEKLADFVIANNGTQTDLKIKVELLHSVISSLNPEAAQKD